MAKITVRIKQLPTAAQLRNLDVLPARSLGWAVDKRSLLITQDDGSDGADGDFSIPSTVGDGMGRRITKAGHGLSLLDPVRLGIDNGVASWGIASATVTGNYNADFVVVRVVDADTFDVARSGSWSVAGVESLVGTVYLSANAKLTTTKPTGVVVQIVGKGDGASLHLLLGSGNETNIDELVDELNARDDLVAIPKGTAGGDLAESYANPVVKQITGVGAAIVSVTTDVSYTPETRESAGTGGRGISPGRHYRTIDGVVTDERCWCASDEYGEAFWSYDYFASTVKDTSIRTGGPLAGASSGYGSCYRWGTRRFIFMGGTINKYAWITGCGRTSGDGSSGVPGIFYAPHEPASYAADGSMLESAWKLLLWNTVTPNGINKSAVHDGTLVWLGDSQYIARTADFVNWQTVGNGGASDYRFTGVATDSYGRWGALSQWGDLWLSVPVGGAEGTAFTKLSTIKLSTDGGKTYSDAAKLPGGSGVCRWSSLVCSYGLWLATIFEPGSTGYSYAYSEDFEHWIVYAGSMLPSFYDAAHDGVRWFATNKYASDAGTLATPPIYQLLVDSANVHRRLNLENGAAVSGPLFMLDLPNSVLGTDENGKIVAVDVSATGDARSSTGVSDNSAPAFTDNGDGTCTVGACSVLLRSSSDRLGSLLKKSVAAATFTIPADGATHYIGVDYSSGVPAYVLFTDSATITDTMRFAAYACWRVDTAIGYQYFGSNGALLANAINRMIADTTPYKISHAGGLVCSEASRVWSVSSATVYAGTTPVAVPSFVAGTSNIYKVVHSGGSWTYTLGTAAYDNANYDDGSNAVAASANKYLKRWLFRAVGSPDRALYVLGTGQYNTAALAEAEALRNDLPGVIKDRCVLVGYAIIQVGATSGSTKTVSQTTANLQGLSLSLALDDLVDVDTSSTAPTNGQALVYNSTSNLWVPGTVGGSGGSAAAKYAATFPTPLATTNIAIPNGTDSQWSMWGTQLIPYGDMTLTKSSTLAVICPQPVSGKLYVLAIYLYNEDHSLTLVCETAISTMPSETSWLTTSIKAAASLSGGGKYYFVMFTTANGCQCRGFAGQHLNMFPVPSIQKDASFQNFAAAPATIAVGGYSENTNNYFGRVLA